MSTKKSHIHIAILCSQNLQIMKTKIKQQTQKKKENNIFYKAFQNTKHRTINTKLKNNRFMRKKKIKLHNSLLFKFSFQVHFPYPSLLFLRKSVFQELKCIKFFLKTHLCWPIRISFQFCPNQRMRSSLKETNP